MRLILLDVAGTQVAVEADTAAAGFDAFIAQMQPTLQTMTFVG